MKLWYVRKQTERTLIKIPLNGKIKVSNSRQLLLRLDYMPYKQQRKSMAVKQWLKFKMFIVIPGCLFSISCNKIIKFP